MHLLKIDSVLWAVKNIYSEMIFERGRPYRGPWRTLSQCFGPAASPAGWGSLPPALWQSQAPTRAALLRLPGSAFACLDLPLTKAFFPLCCKSINSLNMWEVGGQAASESY